MCHWKIGFRLIKLFNYQNFKGTLNVYHCNFQRPASGQRSNFEMWKVNFTLVKSRNLINHLYNGFETVKKYSVTVSYKVLSHKLPITSNFDKRCTIAGRMQFATQMTLWPWNSKQKNWAKNLSILKIHKQGFLNRCSLNMWMWLSSNWPNAISMHQLVHLVTLMLVTSLC